MNIYGKDREQHGEEWLLGKGYTLNGWNRWSVAEIPVKLLSALGVTKLTASLIS